MENFKELYDVTLKATYPIEVNGRAIDIGETIAAFDKIQLGTFDENKSFVTAHGGFDDRNLIWWEETKEVSLTLTQGVFSKTHLALMSNANLITNEGQNYVMVNCRETLETDESGIVSTKHPISEPIFIYDKETGARIYGADISNRTITLAEAPYHDIIVDYYYKYDNKFSVLNVGSPLTTGYLALEGKTRVKDDVTGQVTTGIIRIPKLKLLSTLSIRLGQDAMPMTGRLKAVAVPAGERGRKKVMEIVFLSDEIDSDM